MQPDVEDLQFCLLNLKKENLDLRNENQLQKVKIRKLSEDINRMEKQLDAVFDPRQSDTLSKVLSRHGAHLLIKLREENVLLYKKLTSKDLYIKKLQSQLETNKLYVSGKTRMITSSSRSLEQQELANKISEMGSQKMPALGTNKRNNKRSKSVTQTLERSRSTSPNIRMPDSNTKERKYVEQLNNNLEKIKKTGSLRVSDDKLAQASNSSPFQIKNDVPHEEIQQLQSYFMNLLNEMVSLKSTISDLQKCQTNGYKSANVTRSIQKDENPKPMQQVPSVIVEATTEYDSESETMTSRYSSYPSSRGSGSTELSIAETQYTPKQHRGRPSVCTKSIGVQTVRDFCCPKFVAVDLPGKIFKRNELVGTNEEMAVEYID
ncbi:hypothetical protein Trydic_g19538 [Trypoxylus dichotomus]